MMTVLSTTLSEKRSQDEDAAGSKRIKLSPPVASQQSATSFSSKMIIQLAKSAVASLDQSNGAHNNNNNNNNNSLASVYDDSPIEALANTISLPSNNVKAINSQNLALLISQLTSEIARFDSRNALPLINSILKLNWIYHSNKHSNFSKHYATFLVILVSTIPSWWNDVATKIISDFVKSDPATLSSHHETLRKLISLAPTSSNYLPKLLKSHYPNKNSPKEDHVHYVQNILYVSDYYQVLTNHIWNLVIENFVKLDVEFQNQIDEIDDDDLSEVLGIEEDDDDDDDDDNVSDGDEDNNRSDESDMENDDDDEEMGETSKLNTIDDHIVDSDNEETDDKKPNQVKKIKQVKFAGLDDNDDDEVVDNNKNDDTSVHDNASDDEDFDDEMLDTEADYTIELESLSELSAKIDNLLAYILEYLKPKLSVESLESGHGIPIFNALINSFRTIIIPTHGTKASQYIIFYAAQQQPELIDAFLVALFEVVFNNGNMSSDSLRNISDRINTNLNNKIIGMQYIAGFVARAKKVSDLQIASVVTFLVDYCTAYMEEHSDDDDEDDNDNESSSVHSKNKTSASSHSSRANSNNNNNERKTFNPAKHALFYSLIQALMYIICFRKNSLNQEKSSIEANAQTAENKTGWVASLDRFFTRVIISKYDPLRWCNETVVLIFSRVAQSEGICYTWSVVERIRRERVGRVTNSTSTGSSTSDENTIENNRSSASGSSSSVGSTQSSMRATQEFLDLIAFFPFDPLLLKKSKLAAEDFYVEWSSNDDDEENSDSDESV